MTFVCSAADRSDRVRRLLQVGAALLILAGLLPAWPRAARAAEPGGRLSGVIRDAGGMLQANAQVLLVNASGATVATDTSGSSGRYSLAVAPGLYDLGVLTTSPVERVARIRRVQVGADTTLDVVVLPPEVTLSGTLRDASGTPFGRNIQVYAGWRWVQTDDSGRYSITVPAGPTELFVPMKGPNGEGDFSARAGSFDLVKDSTLDLTVAFTTLTVQVLDQRGDPLPNAVVSSHSADDCPSSCEAGFDLFPGAERTTATSQVYARTDSNGLATITTLPVDQRVEVVSMPPEYRPVSSKRVEWPWNGTVRLVQQDAPTPGGTTDPPATVTWAGVLRHNGTPVEGSVGGFSTDEDGRFEVRLPAGRHDLDISADVGFSDDCDSGGCGPATSIHVPDVDLTADRTMDIDIPTTRLAVRVVDQQGNPTVADVSRDTDWEDTATVELFPGGVGEGRIFDHDRSDAAGNAELLIFPGGAPPVVSASQNGSLRGTATLAPTDTSVTIKFSAVIVSGTIRDARGPLPLVNWPWASFTGSYGRYDEFDGDDLRPDGGYRLQVMPGQHTLTITDEPQFDENDTEGHVATATMPQIWKVSVDLDLTEDTTVDMTIPDTAPARFQTVDRDGQPLPVWFTMATQHTIEIAPGINATARAATETLTRSGQVEHMLFSSNSNVGGQITLPTGEWDSPRWTFTIPRLDPGDTTVLALASTYTGGPVIPVTATTSPQPTTPTTTAPSGNEPVAGTATNASLGRSGYWALASDGAVYYFGDAAHLGNGTPGALDLEPTPSGKGYWVLSRTGTVQTLGDAPPLGNVDLSQLLKGESSASLSATPSGKGYWVFTNRGRAIPFGDAAFLGDVSNLKLNGPVLGSVATPTGRGYYMVASDGGIFAFGDATFGGSMGDKKLNAPVQSLVPDSDGTGYWLVASDGGIFAFDAPFRGSMGDKQVNKPVVGMVRYGNGYLMVGADGGIFNFSNLPFSGSLGDKPPASPVVAVAVLP